MTAPQGDLPDYLAAVGATVSEVWNGTLNPAVSAFVDVTAYNSVLVTAQGQTPGVPIALVYRWQDSFTGRVIDGGLLSANITAVAGSVFGPSWVLPVRGGNLQILNISGQSYLVEIIGQPAFSPFHMNFDGDPARPFSCVIAANAAANSVVAFASAVAGGAPPYYPTVTGYNGLITISLNSAAGTNGAVEAVWPGTDGSLNSTPLLIDTGGGQRSQLVTHPRAFCTWQYRLSAAAPAVAHNAFISITPG